MKKNKKIVALLTLLVFAMTMILPMSAMAAETAADVTVASNEINATVSVSVTASSTYTAADVDGVTSAGEIKTGTDGKGTAAVVLDAANTTDVAKDYVITYTKAGDATDTFTVKVTQEAKPALVSDVDGQASVINVEDKAIKTDETTTTEIVLLQKDGKTLAQFAAGTPVYVWAVESGDTPSTALTEALDADDVDVSLATAKDGVIELDGAKLLDGTTTKKIELKFNRAGTFKVYASLEPYNAANAVPTFKVDANNTVVVTDNTADVEYIEYAGEKLANGETATQVLPVDSNGVQTNKFDVKVLDSKRVAIAKMDVTLDTNSNAITVNPTTATTNYAGEVKDIKVTGTVDGEYKIYVKAGSVEVTIPVKVEAMAADSIKVVKEPSAPLAADSKLDGEQLQFEILDLNGQKLTADLATGVAGAMNLQDKDADNYGDYVKVTAPKDSDLEAEDLSFEAKDGKYLVKSEVALVAGDYTITVALDNGRKVSFNFTVKEFGTAKELVIDYGTDTLELGTISDKPEIYFLDENGVKKIAEKVTIGANGYALENIGLTAGDDFGKVTVKSDEKYVGDMIKVYAVAEREGLTAEAVLNVSNGEGYLDFVEKSGPIDTNNLVNFNIVDKDGNKLVVDAEVIAATAVIAEQSNPDAKVTASINLGDVKTKKGEGTLKVTSNVATTADIKVTVVTKVTDDDGNAKTKVYAGTLEYSFGGSATSADNVVVMTIASKDTIVNDNIVTIDAAPFVNADWRTMVPFRALAEDFGATVEWDEAAQTVTAELDGVKVVMTIGSTTYTVNGVEKTMDTAPVIVDGRTFVPVRFVAEAFGFTVTPTYDAVNGTTESVLFTR